MPFDSSLAVWQIALLTGVSFVAGVLGGFVGLALGTMRLPALLLMGLPAPVAAGTNILVSTLSAATGTIRHWRAGRVDLRIVAVMGLPSLVGAFIGGFASGRAPEGLLLAIAGAFVVWQGIELAARARREGNLAQSDPAADRAVGRGTFTRGRIALEGGIGLVIGLLGGAVGLILGSIRLPALIRVLKINPGIAVGTNLAIGFIMGAFGWLGHVLQGSVDYPLLVFMGVAGMAGTFYGARLTGRVQARTLLLTMGLVLSVVGVLLLWEAYQRTTS